MNSEQGAPAPAPGPYTIWSDRDRHLLVCLLGYLALASSLTANIYFPLLDLLAEQDGVSIQAINLTITLFMVVQGIAPSFWSPLSDAWGRRPVYLATFAVYTLASLGLSIVERNYAALLVLRALQSVGGSTVLSLAYAVVADVSVHADRGRFLAPMLTATNVGPCIGPIIGGGAVLASGDPRWAFRALLIFGGSGVLLIGWTMPETNRNVVGNGSVPAKGIWRTWWSLIGSTWRRTPSQEPIGGVQTTNENGSAEKGEPAVPPPPEPRDMQPTGRGKLILPNPFKSIRLIFYPDTFLTLWLAASPYAVWFCVQTSITPIFAINYGFNELQVGACFLAGGVGIIVGGFISGWMMDKNYRFVAQTAGFTIDRVRGDDLTNFPIEYARSRGSITLMLTSLWATVLYGTVVQKRVHPAVPLLMQAFLGCKCTVLHQNFSALIVDYFPDRPGTAAAANNITRCTLAAAAVAILDPLNRAIGREWVFLLLGAVDAAGCITAVVVLRRRGPKWRAKRALENARPSST